MASSARVAGALTLAAIAMATFVTHGAADEQRVKRLGLTIYAMPTSLTLSDLNDRIDDLNHTTEQFDLAPIDAIHGGAVFGVEGKFFVTRNYAITAGFGRIKRTSALDLLPSLNSRTLIQARIMSVPRTLGLDYYFEPYTRGDFTIRPFAGGGYMSLVETKLKLGGEITNPDTSIVFFDRLKGEGHGFFLESGVHLMFPSRYSVVFNAHYRNARVKRLYEEFTGVLARDESGNPRELDLSGFGLRLGINVSLFGKPPD